MDLRTFGIDSALLSNLQDMMEESTAEATTSQNNPSQAYVRDARAMAATPADVKEYPDAYVFVVDMPGINGGEINVQLENENVLVVSGERKRDKEKDAKDGVKYLKMERRVGKFMRKFVLPENANTEAISAVAKDGVLTVTVEKVPPPEPKRPKTIEVKTGN